MFPFYISSLPCTAHSLLVDDSGLTSSPPYINVSVNSLCQDDNYTITVELGVRIDMVCFFLENVTAENGTAEVPSNMSQVEYCYRAVLSDGDGGVIAGI